MTIREPGYRHEIRGHVSRTAANGEKLDQRVDGEAQGHWGVR
jgi:hypothetical protein